MCERLDKRASFRLSQVCFIAFGQIDFWPRHLACINNNCLQIEDGDIICFQKCPQPQNEEEYRYPDVPSFLEYVKNRQVYLA